MPNIAEIGNRLKLIRGKSIHPSIERFFQQLDRTKNMVAGLHWREYSLQETREIVEKMGYKVIKYYYFSNLDNNIKFVNIKSLI
ncbi:hypothetical protein [Coleofasciculus sp. E2-BRE-01]|uniref:hypothetical protein n=1 Tax=Coleofasciculus sp. E2-BRE-01 TaxID=3069524 RepID=UPI00406388C1